MKRRALRLLSLAAALGLLAAPLLGCSLLAPGGGVKAEELKSGKSRQAAPSAAGVPELVAGNTEFALDLYGALFDPEANLFCSPYSISQALAMTYAGARGDTEQQMAQALHFTLPQEQLHQAWNALDLALASRGEKTTEGQRFRLNVVNALWGQANYGFRPEFLDLLALNYGAGLRTLDFSGAPDASRETINRWVEEQTEKKIKDLLPPDSITPRTRLVLTNAIYFNAGWLYPFQPEATQDGAFHLLDGTSATVPMMHESERLGYAEGEGWQAVELPYVGDELSLVILLPEAGTFETFARGLDSARLASMLQGLSRTQVALSLPRFTFESSLSLKDALGKLGMTQPFSMAADFTGMAARPELFIDDVYHKAFIAVDEAGTEAAAATGVVMNLKAMPTQPKEVQVDRPFIFLIRDVQSGSILFLGHVVDPA